MWKSGKGATTRAPVGANNAWCEGLRRIPLHCWSIWYRTTCNTMRSTFHSRVLLECDTVKRLHKSINTKYILIWGLALREQKPWDLLARQSFPGTISETSSTSWRITFIIVGMYWPGRSSYSDHINSNFGHLMVSLLVTLTCVPIWGDFLSA